MAIILPHNFQDGIGEIASGVQVMENFNVLKALLEGNLSDENMAAAIKDGVSGAHSLRTLGTNAGQALSFTDNVKQMDSTPTIGPTPAVEYTETGIAFPTACLAVFVAGWTVWSDAGHSAAVATIFNAGAGPSGKNISVIAQNNSGITLFPRIKLVAIGH